MNTVVFLHGCPAVGKTTIAREIHRLVLDGHELAENFLECVVLDGDMVRRLWPELGLSSEDRLENHKRAAMLASLIANQTLSCLTIVSMIGPDEECRDTVKKILEYSSEYFNFYNIWLDCPVEERKNRDPKGLYKKVDDGDISGLTGYDGRYEQPFKYDLKFDTYKYDALAIATAILSYVG